mgnify:CR=1 FL=1
MAPIIYIAEGIAERERPWGRSSPRCSERVARAYRAPSHLDRRSKDRGILDPPELTEEPAVIDIEIVVHEGCCESDGGGEAVSQLIRYDVELWRTAGPRVNVR